MKRKIRLKVILPTVVILAIVGVFIFQHTMRQLQTYEEETSIVDDAVEHLLEARLMNRVDAKAPEIGQDVVTILLLGLDGRAGDQYPHCDANHFFEIDTVDWTITITSIPRGTYVYIPPGVYPQEEQYLANACSHVSLEYGVQQMEYITGLTADYIATVNFSQTQGILRLFDMPATESLQWLRHRQSYQIGEPQRLHNQAVFMKDMIVEQAERLRGDFSAAMQYVAYNVIDTDLPFETLRLLVDGLLDANIDDRPDDITLQMRPYYETVDYHFDSENPDEQLASVLEWIAPYLSPEDYAQQSKEDVEALLIAYFDESIANETVEAIMTEQIWWQFDNEDLREYYRYEAMMIYIDSLDTDEVIDLLSDYILEKELFGQMDYAAQATAILKTYLY